MPTVQIDHEATGRAARPWATLGVTMLAGLIFVTSAERGLIFDRGLIFQGQVWRIWTGHFVHFTPSHLLWDLAVFLPAGCWVECLWPSRTRWFYALAPAIISGALLMFDPALLRYAGLSGLAAGVMVLLAALQLKNGHRTGPVWMWIALLLLVTTKIAYEFFGAVPLLVKGLEDVRNVPRAHLVGAAWALGMSLFPHRHRV